MIHDIQHRWNELEKKRIVMISKEFSISQSTAKKYIHMSEEEINGLDNPQNYKKRKTIMDDYLNIIYKMLYDTIDPTLVFSYIIKSGYEGNLTSLETYIRLLAKNNFGVTLYVDWPYRFDYPPDITVIKRNELLKYITIKNPKIEKDERIGKYIDKIRERYEVVGKLEKAYDDFYQILMGEEPEKLEVFIAEYEDSIIKGFVDGIKRDITPVKNAISHDESSGFVEGNNNKFKLIKRILYGRANLVNLFKKCYVAFRIKSADLIYNNSQNGYLRTKYPFHGIHNWILPIVE